MSEDFIYPIVITAVVGSALLSWLIMRWLGDRWARINSILFAGIVPLVLIAIAILIWHYVEVQKYNASGSQDGFMGPGLILVYGFPYFLIMLAVDFAAAASFKKRK